MRFRIIYFKIIGFIILFSSIFTLLHSLQILPVSKSVDIQNNLPWLFSAISLIFSIISGFIIQSKWQTWNELIDATHGEISSLKQLHMLANHFPLVVQNTIRAHIADYLSLIIEETSRDGAIGERSEKVEKAIYALEETVLDINYSEHPNIGSLAFDLVRKCLEYREKRLQNISHKLPTGVRFYVVGSTFAIVLFSLFVSINQVYYDYFFTLILSLLAFGIYLLIDDLDHPYRPGQWQLTKDGYITLLNSVEESRINPSSHHTNLQAVK